jgi:tRNA (cmo5U34)-methyltransferase
MKPFSDPKAVTRYAEGPVRLVPGFESLQRMVMVLLAERAPADARILVLGAGGGLELKAFADAQPGWRFDGVDPSASMLDLARETLGPLISRAELHQGIIDAAPEGPYDAATCILTMHFIEKTERLRTLREVHRRMKPDAPFAVAHFSFPQDPAGRDLWMSRYAAYAVASGVEPTQMEKAREAIGETLPILAPEDEERLLVAAGFHDVTQFYMGFAFRGWVGYA